MVLDRIVPLPLAFATLLIASLTTGCGPAKPKASDYVGHWEGTYRSDSGGEYPCHLHISLVGQSLVVKSEDETFRPCEGYAQVLSLTEDGTAKGGPMGMVTLLFDKEKNEIIVNGIPTSRSLQKSPQYHEIKDRLVGTWKKVPIEGGQMLTDVLLVEVSADGSFAVREKEVIDNHEFQNVKYDNGTLRGTFYMAVDREWRTPFQIKSPSADTITYSDERGSESFQRQQ